MKLRALPLGLDNLYLPSEEAQRKAFELASRPPSGDRKWKRGEMEFEAMMRHLDNAVSTIGLPFGKRFEPSNISHNSGNVILN